MAEMLLVSCGGCGVQEVQLDGPVMAGYRPRCEQCGRTSLVRWHVLADDGGRRPSSMEALASWLTEQAGTCECGGRFSVDAPIRCSGCRSTDLRIELVGNAD